MWVQGLTSVRLPCPLRVSLAESLISTSPSGKMILAILGMSCVWEGAWDWPAWGRGRGHGCLGCTHRQMIFSVRTARFPTPSLSFRLSCSANHTSERSGVRSHAVSPSLFRSSGLAPRDRNNLKRNRRPRSETGQWGVGARGSGS